MAGGHFLRVGGRVVYIEDPIALGHPRRGAKRLPAARLKRMSREERLAPPKPAKEETKPKSAASKEPETKSAPQTTEPERVLVAPKPPLIAFAALPLGTTMAKGEYLLTRPIVCTTRPNVAGNVVLLEIRGVPKADPLSLGPNLWSIGRGTRIQVNKASAQRILADVL